MRVITLRFGENFAPKSGTINAHIDLINKHGFVWFGKYGNAISVNTITDWQNQDECYILLIKSGTLERYWGRCVQFERNIDSNQKKYIPKYYSNDLNRIKCWFKLVEIFPADQKVMSKCTLVSNGSDLTTASKVSMNPCMYCNFNGKI